MWGLVCMWITTFLQKATNAAAEARAAADDAASKATQARAAAGTIPHFVLHVFTANR